jgi:hypothetical protein
MVVVCALVRHTVVILYVCVATETLESVQLVTLDGEDELGQPRPAYRHRVSRST